MLISLGTVLGAVIPILIFAIPKLLVAFDIMTFDDKLNVMSVLPNSGLSSVGATGERTDDSKIGQSVTVSSYRKFAAKGPINGLDKIRKSRTITER